MTSSANRLIQAAAGAAGDRPDEHFGDVVLLLDGDGTSFDSNSSYSDESSNARTVTAVNNPRQGSFSPYGNRWSTYYDGSSSDAYTGGSQYEANTTGFTVSFWANGLGNGTRIFVGKGTINSAANSSWWVETVSGAMRFYISNGSGYVICTDPAGFETYGGWVHVAAVIDNGTAKLYMNGQLKDSQTVTTTNATGTVPVYIGGYTTSFPFEGYISNVRIHQSALYSGTSFTVPKTVRRENATFWANFDKTGDYFVNHGGPTVTGTPRVVPYSPVTQYAITSDDEIDIADGGSVYFDGYDGATDYLTFTAAGYNSVTDFTISFWIYPENMANTGSGFPRAFASGSYTGAGNFIIYMRDDDIRLYFGGERIQTPLEKYKWTHISLQRSGGTFTLYKNGVSAGTSALSTAVNFATTNSIGSEISNWGMKGYIAGFRLTTNGSTPVTVPTGPLTDVTDTQLLMNFKDAGIYDKSGMQNLDTLGGVSLGAAPIYGTGSLKFDGAGDYVGMPVKPHFDFSTADFTIESWVNLSATGQFNPIVYLGRDTHTGIVCDVSSSNNPRILADIGAAWTTVATGSTALEKNRWYHLAFVRNGSSFKIYVDGVQDASATYAGSITAATSDSSSVAQIGYLRTNGGADRYFNGYLDDLRVTNGVARYASNFTPPTEIDLSSDTYAEYVTLFLDGDGTVNGQNNTFTDSSTNDFTITKTGNVVQGVFSPYGDNWSNYFDGSGDRIIVPTSAALDFGTGTFTVELWFYIVSQSNNDGIISKGTGGGDGWQIVVGNTNNRLKFIRTSGTASNSQITSGDVDRGKWYHLALTRDSSNDVRLFLNGTQEGTYSDSTSWDSTADLRIGTNRGQNNDFNGYISNVRVIKGTALYTASFTPPNSPLSAVTNTKLLTSQSNRFIDNSSTAASLTFAGEPKVSRFSPFESDKPYDITTDGGSGYFDDSSNSYLQIADNSAFDATTSLCIEAWFYMTSSPGSGPSAHAVVSKWVSTTPGQRTLFIDIESTGLRVMADLQGASNPVTITTDGGAISLHEWHHVAVTWDGSTYRAFLDGALEGSTSSSSAPVASSQVVRVGHNTNTHYFGGYITDARWVTDGGAIYTSAFTPPTSPLTAITNTELLLNFQDSAIPDLSGLNNIDTVGNAKVAGTDPTKYGSNAIAFDGASGYLKTYDNEVIELGAHDFTIEFWVYFNAVNDSTVKYLFDWRTASDTTNSFLAQEANNNWTYYNATGSAITTGLTASTFSANTWHHLAISREGSTARFFVDGTNVGSPTDSTTYDSGTLVIGSRYNGQNYLDGHIDDLRITKGVARYTSSFTPPTEALPKF